MDNRCKLDILPPAQAELEEIARVHMALSGPQSARNITDGIYDAMDQLTRFPLSGPPVRDDELSAAGYRYILAGKYLVFYRLLWDTVAGWPCPGSRAGHSHRHTAYLPDYPDCCMVNRWNCLLKVR